MGKIYFGRWANLKATFMFTLLLAILSHGAFAQNTRYTVTGTVTDARTKTPLPGVVVKFLNSNTANATDVNGKYSLTANLPAGTHKLTFSYIGFKPETKSVVLGASPTVTVDAQLSEDIVGLDEVVVTGTSVATSKKQLGNAISTVSSAALENSVATSID